MSAHERLFGSSRENSSSPPESPSGKKGSSISSGDSSMSPIASPIFKSDTARAIAKEVGLVDPKVRAKKRSLTITGTNPASVIEALNNHHAKVKRPILISKFSGTFYGVSCHLHSTVPPGFHDELFRLQSKLN